MTTLKRNGHARSLSGSSSPPFVLTVQIEPSGQRFAQIGREVVERLGTSAERNRMRRNQWIMRAWNLGVGEPA